MLPDTLTETTILERSRAMGEKIVAWRRDLHQHPELGFHEFRTAGIVAQELRNLGYEVQTGVGKTGVVATIGDGVPVVAIRADMDALPIHELNDVSYISQTDGKMHACGHDSHTAMLLGAAHLFAEMQDQLPGTIRLIFQPCEETQDEEGRSGADRMVEEGAMIDADRVIALHIASDLPAGKIVLEKGFISANTDTFSAVIKGIGGHGADPHQTVDPVFILAQIINAIHGIRARRINPIKPAVISIGSIHAGVAENVIPDAVNIGGTIRSYDDETREKLWQELNAAFALSRAFGGDYELKIIKGCPSVNNDPFVVDTLKHTAVTMLGEDAILSVEPGMGGEDFSFMTRSAPGAMFLLGAKYDDQHRPHHSPIFDLDESVFPIGTAMLVSGALNLMQAHFASGK